MILVSATVGPFKSIDSAQKVQVREDYTVLVGMNEAGKTVFLQALTKTRDATARESFNHIDDYPRKDLTRYLKKHATDPGEVVSLTYMLSPGEAELIVKRFGVQLPKDFTFDLTYTYANTSTVGITIDEQPVIKALSSEPSLSTDAKAAIAKAKSVRDIPAALGTLELTEGDRAFLEKTNARIKAADAKPRWESVVEWEVWQWLNARLPKFLYFGEYELLPSKTNLPDLAAKVEQAKTNPKALSPEDRGALALLRMADIALKDFAEPGGYEPLKAKIEAVSIQLTDQIMAFWKQNEDLEVEVDIKPDPSDQPPYNNGPNLYLRIKNRRHRGVSTPFRQRSRGFIWFFSFLVWFDSVKHQLDGQDCPLILLLDEPGLSLHALAQRDFLKYIEDLSKRHQVLYTTHSPFMVPNDLKFVRTVEDQKGVGTIISEDVTGSDDRTLFPLQAALGYSIAQNLFVSEQNLLVEGTSELIYLRSVSSALEAKASRTGLRDDVTIAPTGGLDKVCTFVALLGANDLKLAVLHDYRGAPEQKLMDLVQEKMISRKAVLNASQYRDLSSLGTSGSPADIEDLFTPSLYLKVFNAAYKGRLPKAIDLGDLPPGDRIVDRITRYLAENQIALRSKGGFNHHLVAAHFASSPELDDDTLARFEALFVAVNDLF